MLPSARPATRAAIAIVMLLAGYGAAASEAFNPIRRLTTWYTDRSLVDIQITGSTSTLDDLHRLEPDRVLRLRLERAYVTHLLAEKGPGFESVFLGFDMETQLPDALILAANQPKQFREEFPGIPKLSLQEWGQRRLSVRLRSDRSAATLRRISGRLVACMGASEVDELSAYLWEGRSNCSRPIYPNGSKHIAQYDGQLLEIECQGESFRGLGCKLRFPFERFAVELAFHRSHLPKWRDVVDRASAFLKAKKYQ